MTDKLSDWPVSGSRRIIVALDRAMATQTRPEELRSFDESTSKRPRIDIVHAAVGDPSVEEQVLGTTRLNLI